MLVASQSEFGLKPKESALGQIALPLPIKWAGGWVHRFSNQDPLDECVTYQLKKRKEKNPIGKGFKHFYQQANK
jgi:hypothetical protein